MQKLIFFIDSNGKDYGLASNIGNLYMNRFTIDEDAGHEIVKIYEVVEHELEILKKKNQIGMSHILFKFHCSHCQ